MHADPKGAARARPRWRTMTVHALVKRVVLTWAVLVSLAWAGACAAQGWPTRPVRILVPFPAGSATDVLARIMARDYQDSLGQPVLVENRPGAGGNIASEALARSAPDGYTLMIGTNTQYAANVGLYRKLPYDPLKDFAPVARLGVNALVLLVRPDFPARTLAEFVTHAKARPGKLTAGFGSSSSQVSVAMLRTMGGLDVLDVPYKGIPLAVNDLMSGVVDFTFADTGNALSQVRGGTLRALAVTSEKRTPLAPDWPAIAELLPGYEVTAWFALAAPAGTPRDIVQRLHEVSARALAKPEVRDRLAAMGTTPAPLGPEELAVFMRAEVAHWARLLAAAGIKPE